MSQKSVQYNSTTVTILYNSSQWKVDIFKVGVQFSVDVCTTVQLCALKRTLVGLWRGRTRWLPVLRIRWHSRLVRNIISDIDTGKKNNFVKED